MPADFIAHLDADITTFEGVITDKGGARRGQVNATSGLEDAAHKDPVHMHVLNTLARNKYKNDPAKLAEWTAASHAEKHTPVPKAKPAVATP